MDGSSSRVTGGAPYSPPPISLCAPSQAGPAQSYSQPQALSPQDVAHSALLCSIYDPHCIARAVSSWALW